MKKLKLLNMHKKVSENFVIWTSPSSSGDLITKSGIFFRKDISETLILRKNGEKSNPK